MTSESNRRPIPIEWYDRASSALTFGDEDLDPDVADRIARICLEAALPAGAWPGDNPEPNTMWVRILVAAGNDGEYLSAGKSIDGEDEDREFLEKILEKMDDEHVPIMRGCRFSWVEARVPRPETEAETPFVKPTHTYPAGKSTRRRNE